MFLKAPTQSLIQSQPGQYALSMKDGDAVRHYRIEAAGEGKYHLQGVCGVVHKASSIAHAPFQSSSPDFSALQELVAFHKNKRAGLTTTLKDPCPKEVQAK